MPLQLKLGDRLSKNNFANDLSSLADQLNAFAVLRDFVPQIQDNISALYSSVEGKAARVIAQSKGHMENSLLWGIASDYHLLESVQLFSSMFVSGDQFVEMKFASKFDEISDSIFLQIKEINEFFESKWKSSAKRFSENYEILMQHSTGADKGLLVELMSVLKVIKYFSFCKLLIIVSTKGTYGHKNGRSPNFSQIFRGIRYSDYQCE